MRGHGGIVEILIKNNVDVNCKFKDGSNSLMWGIFIYLIKNVFIAQLIWYETLMCLSFCYTERLKLS